MPSCEAGVLRAACLGPGALRLGMAMGAAEAGAGAAAGPGACGVSIGTRIGVLDGSGDGVMGVGVGSGVAWRVAIGVSKDEILCTGALGAGTLLGCGKIQLLTATRTGAGRC